MAPERRSAPAAAGADLSSHRILVVDDNLDAAESMGLLLEGWGAEVCVANGGAEALVLVQTWLPHIAFLVLGMPVMDGHELAQRLRADPRFERVELVALTGWGQEADRARTASTGFDKHFVKPVDSEVLQSLIASMTS